MPKRDPETIPATAGDRAQDDTECATTPSFERDLICGFKKSLTPSAFWCSPEEQNTLHSQLNTPFLPAYQRPSLRA